MTVSTEVDHNDYTGNGVTTVFPYQFRIFKAADLTVVTVDLDENQHELILGTDYSVTGAGSYQGGSVVLASALATGWQISIARELPVTQETDLRNQGKFFAEVHENAFDKLTMLIQQVFSHYTLALRKPSFIANYYDALNNRIRNLRDPSQAQDAATKNYVDSLADTNLSRTLRVPEPINQLPDAAARANKMPAFDNAGNVIVVLPPSGSASDVLIEMAKPTGADLSGYQNPQSLVVETVKTALDKINVRVIYATDFGVKTDASDNADALWALGQFISNATTPLRVIFPHGTSLVGSQELAGATGKGYSYRPTYFNRNWGDASDRGWFSVHRTDNDITLDMTGWTLKINAGMRQGSFDPITGSVAPDQVAEAPNTDFLASHGYLIKIYKCPNVKMLFGTTDGSIPHAVWGGKYGNTGYQVPSYNMWINQSSGIYIKGHRFFSSPVDGLYHQSTGTYGLLDVVKKSLIKDCIYESCGRNNYTLAGGANIDIIRPVSIKSGRLAQGIGSHYSGPEAGIDFEAEGGDIYDINILDPKVVSCGANAFMTVATPGVVNDVSILGGVLQSYSSLGAVSNHGPSRNIKLNNVTIIGGVIDAGGTMGSESYAIEDCILLNQYGNNYASSYLLNFKVSKFNRNTILFGIPPSGVPAATINIDDQDGFAFGLYSDRFKGNKLTIYGDASLITFENGLGGLNNFKNAELYVDSSGLTGGSIKLLTDTTSSSLSGLSTNTTNFNFNVTMDKDVGKNVWYARKAVRAAGVLTATSDAQQDIGSVEGRFRTAYVDLGVIIKDSAVPTNHYRIRVTNGAVQAVLDNS